MESETESVVVAIDLSTTEDAARLINFLRSSPGTSEIPIVAIGTTADFDRLDPGARAGVVEMLHVSATSKEIEAAIAKHLKSEGS